MGDAENAPLQDQVRQLQGENAALLDLIKAVVAVRGEPEALVEQINGLTTRAVLRCTARLDALGPHQPGEGNPMLDGYMSTIEQFLARD